MTQKFEYAGGVLPEEAGLIERFEKDLFPYLEKHGPTIGEAAFSGDVDAEAVLIGYHRFINGLPGLRQENFNLCVSALKRFEHKARQ